MVRTYEEIYKEMLDKREFRFSVRELLYVWEKEISWIGERQQMLWLRSYQLELTGIRPGECSACNHDVGRNMIRWVNQYESDNNIEYNFKPQ